MRIPNHYLSRGDDNVICFKDLAKHIVHGSDTQTNCIDTEPLKHFFFIIATYI